MITDSSFWKEHSSTRPRVDGARRPRARTSVPVGRVGSDRALALAADDLERARCGSSR